MHDLAVKLTSLFSWLMVTDRATLNHEEDWSVAARVYADRVIEEASALRMLFRPRQKNPVPGRETWVGYLEVVRLARACYDELSYVDDTRATWLRDTFPAMGGKVGGSLLAPWEDWAWAVRARLG